ncbi:MAG: FG-GAP-like repeat-containing protein [Planctomycetota bacterium]|jgi:tetratricopeptide (TPR) repeat protein
MSNLSDICGRCPALAFWVGLTAIAGAVPVANASSHFTDVAEKAGIRHRHFAPILDHKLDNIMSWVTSVGAAAAAGDFNRDGWLDIYVTNSRKGKPNYLYRNNGNGTFTDVAPEAGLSGVNGDRGTSMDCVWGDFDNDGWLDLYLLRWGEDSLFRNNGDETFTEVTSRYFKKRDGSPGTDWANGNSVIVFDYDLDGRLDIYVGNYFREVDLWNLEDTRIMHNDFERARNGGTNFLYHQKSDGTFEQIAEQLGVEDPGWTLSAGSADLNNDGFPDLYCADDFGPDQLFLNKGNGQFANVTEDAIGFDTKKGMNADFGDFNNDGWLDVYVTNITTAEYLQEGNMLWHNNGVDGNGQFSMIDISLETGTYDGGWGWGGKFFDYDNDGDLDIITVNGFISAGEGDYWYDLASWTVTDSDEGNAANWPTIGKRSFSGYEHTRLFCNNGFFSFAEKSKSLGLGDTRDGRGVVVFDYDNDGDRDVFVANQGAQPHLYQNNVPGDNRKATGHNWLQIELVADPSTGTNADAVHTRVTLVSTGDRQIRERDGGNGYCGQSDPRIHFGLGKHERAKLLEIRWPDGGLQYVENIKANQTIRIKQDPSRYAARVAVQVAAPKRFVREEKHAPRIKADPAQVEKILTQLESKLRKNPNGHTAAGHYRKRCATNNKHERAVKFLKGLAKERPNSTDLRIELACAYVDKIPTCGGLAAIVSKGSLANKSIGILDEVIDSNPGHWLAYYCRAMNHLHWPRALRHSDDAVEDFAKCLTLQNKSGDPGEKAYYVRTYIGLGDAYAKMGSYGEARKAWRDGLRHFPDNQALKTRVGIADDDELFDFVMDQRSLEKPIDTDLAFVQREAG